MRSTRLVLANVDGALIASGPSTENMTATSLDLTGMPNTDQRAPLMVLVQQLCDMDGWHTVGRVPLPPYSDG
jgi:hypothetical protein